MTTKTRNKRSRVWLAAAVMAAVLVAGVAVVTLRGGNGSAANATFATYEVDRGPLTISVLATGNVRSAQSVTLTNDTQQRTTIVYLAEEGTMVEEGDLLVELDPGDLEDERLRQEIQLETARSDFIQAEQNLEVVRQQAQADTDAAEVEFDLATLDLEKYLEGESAQELREAERSITLAQADLEQARDRLEGSERLYKAGYITQAELLQDQIAQQRAELDLDMAKGNHELLTGYAAGRREKELRSDVRQKAFELTKVKHSAESSIVEAEARLSSRKLSYEREQERLERVIAQIEACTIYAPVAGMVVHGTSGGRGRGNQEPLAAGVEVTPRQDLVRLPTADRMIADVKIQEAMLHGLRDRMTSEDGVRVRVTSDAVPGREFEGRVRRIAVMPDAQSRWMNPDLKVYNTEVEIVGDTSGLWSGMSCTAEIIVEEFDDVKYVPLQAVTRVGGRPVVYMPTPNGPQARQVEVGLDNNRMVQVVNGLARGEQVLLNPPLERSSRSSRRQDAESGEGEGERDGEGQPGEPERPGGRPQPEAPQADGGEARPEPREGAGAS